MFRILETKPGEGVTVHDDPAFVAPPTDGGERWIDVVAPTEDDLRLLGERFGFHPLALEDCSHADQRPKSEEYGDYLFIVVHGFDWPDPSEAPSWRELHAFLGRDYLVTVHDHAIGGLDHVWRRVTTEPGFSRSIDFIYYLVVDHCVDENFPILDRIADELDDLEVRVLERPEKDCLARIFALRGHLQLMRKVLSPQRDVMAMLSRRGDERVSEKTSLYFRDVYDHLARIVESIEGHRELLNNALDAYLSATSQRTNEIMKALAIVSAVFLPLTFITGFFGQNFAHLPFESDPLMYTMIVACIVLPAALLIWFKRRNWI